MGSDCISSWSLLIFLLCPSEVTTMPERKRSALLSLTWQQRQRENDQLSYPWRDNNARENRTSENTQSLNLKIRAKDPLIFNPIWHDSFYYLWRGRTGGVILPSPSPFSLPLFSPPSPFSPSPSSLSPFSYPFLPSPYTFLPSPSPFLPSPRPLHPCL